MILLGFLVVPLAIGDVHRILGLICLIVSLWGWGCRMLGSWASLSRAMSYSPGCEFVSLGCESVRLSVGIYPI